MTSTQVRPAAERLDSGVLKISGVVLLGVLMSILDTTVVSVALPTFQTAFDAQYSTVAWTMTGYTLALATVIPVTGWAADRFGTKRLYVSAIIMFVIASILCSLSWNITSLITFRILQGLGGGMLMPLGMTMLTRAAGPQRIGRVMALLGVPMLLGPIGGPILGGWLVDAASWHWIFLINVPIGIIAVIAATIVLPKDKPQPGESFDFVGMLLLSPGLALFLFGVSSIPQAGTIAATKVLLPAIIGLVLIGAFLVHALKARHPLIDLHLFRHRQLSISVVTMALFAIAFFGGMLLFPTYFIQVRGETALSAGLLLAPLGTGAMITMPIAGKLTDVRGPRWVVLAGVILIAAGMSVFTGVSDTTSYTLLLGALFVMGMGMGATMMPIMSAALGSLTHHEAARGSTLMNIIQQASGSIGTAVMSVILTNEYLKHSAVVEFQAAAAQGPQAIGKLDPSVLAQVPGQMADGFGAAYTVAVILISLCVIPTLFMSRHAIKKSAPPEADAEDLAADANVVAADASDVHAVVEAASEIVTDHAPR